MPAVHLTNSQFYEKAEDSSLPMLVDFWAAWCPPCRTLAPIIDELAEELHGKVVVGKVDADEQTELADQFGVLALPTVLYIQNGAEAGRLVGLKSKEDYLALCGL